LRRTSIEINSHISARYAKVLRLNKIRFARPRQNGRLPYGRDISDRMLRKTVKLICKKPTYKHGG